MNTSTQRGISLIELLVALAIAAILLGLSLPSFAGLKSKGDVAATHNLLLAGFAQARDAAVMQRKPAVICPGSIDTGCRSDGLWEGGWLVFVDKNADGKFSPADTLLRSETGLDASIAIRSSKHRTRVTFQPTGMAEGSNLTIKFCAADGAPLRGLVTSNTGRTRASTAAEVTAMTKCF